MKTAKLLSIGFILSGVYSIASAQQQQMSVAMDSVVIHENRTPTSYIQQNRSIQILDRRQIEALPVKSTNELLSYIAGVDLQQRGPWGAQADVSIDGSTADEVLLLVNGVKMADPQTGHNMLTIPIPISSIDHIEVISGPASREYGIYAMAGAINIITRLPKENEVSAQAYAGSSFQKDTSNHQTYNGWGAQASASLAAKGQSHVFSIAHDEGNGYRYNTGFNSYRMFYQDKFELNAKNSIEAMGGYIYNTFGANNFYAAPYDVEAKETAKTAVGSLKYTFAPNKDFSISPRISYWYGKDDYIYIRQKPEVYHNIHENNVLTGEVQSALKLGNGTLGAGVELRNEGINSNNLGKHNRNNLGLYAEYKYAFSNKLNATIGVYGNNNSDYGWEALPSISAGYMFAPSWKLFANASTGERLPTYTDLYYVGPSNIGDSLLKPEHTAYAEGGIQVSKAAIYAQASYFYRHTTDFIDWIRAVDTLPWQPQNFQSITIQGIKLQFTFQLSRTFRLPSSCNIILDGSYTHLDPKVEFPSEKISKYSVEALRNQAVLSLRSTFFGKLQFNFNARYLQRITANDYTLLDARVGYKLKKFSVYADVNNILNTQYKEISAVPLPGTWYTVGLKFDSMWK